MIPTAIVTGCALAVMASGYLKVVRPGPAQTAIDAADLPFLSGRPGSARLVGVAEVAIGIAAVAADHAVTDALLAALYGAFAVFVDRLRRHSPDTGCGCIGATSQPPGIAHIVVVLAAAVACMPSVAAQADRLGAGSLARTVGEVAIAAVVAVVILLVPGALEARRRART